MPLSPFDPTEIPLLFKSRQFDRIIDGIHAHLDTVGDESPPHQNWFGWLAVCHYFKSEFHQAVVHYDYVLNVDPDNVSGNANLAHIYSCCPDPIFHDAFAAIRHARHACDVSKWKNFPAIQTLVTSYLRSGDYQAASSTAQKSLSLATAAQRWRVDILLQCIHDETAFVTSLTDDFDKLCRTWPADE